MSKLVIKTDGKWKDFVYGYEVPPKIMASQFDYLKDGEESDGFFKYKGTWHHTSQFMRFGYPGPGYEYEGWDGVMNWSFSNGLLLKISKDGEQYKVAYYYVTSG